MSMDYLPEHAENARLALIPCFAMLLGESPKSLLDILAYAERMGWLDSTEVFIGARKLRNLLVHKYMENAELFLESLQAADHATLMLMDVIERVERQADNVGLLLPSDV